MAEGRIAISGYMKEVIPWRQVATYLAKALLPNAQEDTFFGPNWSVRSLEGGYSGSEMLILDPDWQGIDREFVVKITRWGRQVGIGQNGEDEKLPLEKVKRRKLRRLRFHTNETLILRILNASGAYNSPILLCANELDETNCVGFLVMEKFQNFRTIDTCDLLPTSSVHQVLRWMARFQSFGQKIDADRRTSMTNYDLFGDILPFNVHTMREDRALLSCDRYYFPPELSTELAAMQEVIGSFDQAYLDGVVDVIKNSGEPVLCHGDLYSRNMVLRNDSEDLLAIFDFQNVHFGCGAVDLAMVLGDVVSGDERLKRLPELLATFYALVCDEFGGVDKVPYTFDQLKEAMLAVTPIIITFQVHCNGLQFEDIVRRATDKDKAREQLITKMRSDMGNIGFYYELRKQNGCL